MALFGTTPTLDDFDLSNQTGGLCISDASYFENALILGATALIIGVAVLLIGQVARRRAAARLRQSSSEDATPSTADQPKFERTQTARSR